MYDVIVVGAGISGLLSALTLGKRGKNVLVLEKSGYVGGNCNSYCVDGFWVDTGPHAITHLQKGPLRILMDGYFDYIPAFVDYGTYYVRTAGGIRPIPSNLREFVTFDVLPRKDRLILSQALTKALTLSTFGIDTSKTSVYSCLPRNLSKKTYDFVDTIAYFLSGKSMKETSVYRVLYGSSFLRDSVMYETENQPLTDHLAEQITNITGIRRLITNKTSYAQAYPRGGLKALLNSALHSLPDNVEIRTDTRVNRILADDGVACGVSTDYESYDAEIVLHSGFARDLPALIDDLPADYRHDLGRIDQARSMCIWLGLSQRLKEFDYTGSEVWFQEKAYWAMPISNYSSTIAPKGKQLVGFMFVVKDSVKREKERAWETIHQVFPDIEKYIEMIHYQFTTPEKAAVSINGYIPGVRTPLKNLYLVGTDAAAESMGITRAAYSVIDLIKCMKEDGYLRSEKP
ncbi:MAG TPA: NAD(P)/FAD-dependent oxidoreductase [Methanosarcinales archaeon]|nr:NAD(P)/FAD-dependent oxidoreductase [Methanosarcinales archaeon]